MRPIVTIGGGSGHAQVLKALKRLDDVVVTAICGSTDSGGSSGILARDYGSLGYLGDLTRCIAALCPQETLVKALLHRVQGGCLHGHSMKNLMLLFLEQVHDYDTALELMHVLCGVHPHRVMPVTRQPTELCARLRAGNEIAGETNIDNLARNPLWNPSIHAIEEVFLKPHVDASDAAVQAIGKAEWCVICPGDLYSSIIPVLISGRMREAFQKSSAEVMVILNIMTKNGETHNYHAEDFVNRIEAKLGRQCTTILYNSEEIDQKALFQYKLEKKVRLATSTFENDPRIVRKPFVMMNEENRLYHDPVKLASALSATLT
jgi:uncharacterized cofD-like protein